MFVCSVKTSRRGLRLLAACLAGAVAILLLAVFWPAGDRPTAVTMGDRAARIAYLQALGYVVDPDTEEVREVILPDPFDDAFSAYNELQKQAGGDLLPYAGKRVKCWSYELLNVPGDGTALAHLYISRDRVIGGDISAAMPGGMAAGLVPLEELPKEEMSETIGTTG